MSKPPDKLQSSHSGVRSMVEGDAYTAFNSLEEARGNADTVVIFEGDYGGTIYMTVPIDRVKCAAATLAQALQDIDAMCWGDPDGAGMFFEERPVGSGVPGGMGGGTVTGGLWLHPNLEPLGIRDEIEEVLAGSRRRIEPTGRDWDSVRPKPKLP